MLADRKLLRIDREVGYLRIIEMHHVAVDDDADELDIRVGGEES